MRLMARGIVVKCVTAVGSLRAEWEVVLEVYAVKTAP